MKLPVLLKAIGKSAGKKARGKPKAKNKAAEVEQDGRRYLNTGAWTEQPHYYVSVNGHGIELKAYPNGTVAAE